MTDERKAVQPFRGTLQHTEFKWNTYGVEVRAGVTLDDVLLPEFWAYTKGLKPLDLLRVICETGEWEAEIRVLGMRDSGPVLRLLGEWTGDQGIDRPGHDVDHKGGSEYVVGEKMRVSFSRVGAWRVIRLSDGQILQKDLPDKGVAIKQAREYIQIEN